MPCCWFTNQLYWLSIIFRFSLQLLTFLLLWKSSHLSTSLSRSCTFQSPQPSGPPLRVETEQNLVLNITKNYIILLMLIHRQQVCVEHIRSTLFSNIASLLVTSVFSSLILKALKKKTLYRNTVQENVKEYCFGLWENKHWHYLLNCSATCDNTFWNMSSFSVQGSI